MRINLVCGHSAGGMLRQAVRDFGLPGEVRVIDDDLSLGPLHDDKTRNEWWLTVYGPWRAVAYQPDLYNQWQAVRDHLGKVSELVLWSSNSARDHVFERMAASMLGDRVTIFRVLAPACGKLEGVSFHNPDALAGMEQSKREIGPTEAGNWAASFSNHLRQSHGIRVLQQGAIVARPENHLDEYLLERCPLEWTKWYRPIGNAMADGDGQNLISDAFLSWRLRLLVEAGRVEAQGDLTPFESLKDVLVRRVPASWGTTVFGDREPN
ncbi:MAG: DUF1835 domain-containing protein [Hyphomonadaceae bacterium JAD_PAG50586_4]|nr:MAG: DUF1835 domain-containing protein [Hyphomonadaceae bacterium JAD_PAG50586_4]